MHRAGFGRGRQCAAEPSDQKTQPCLPAETPLVALGELWWLDDKLPLPASAPDEGGAKPVGPIAHPATDPGGPASHHSSLDDELLRQQTQLL